MPQPPPTYSFTCTIQWAPYCFRLTPLTGYFCMLVFGLRLAHHPPPRSLTSHHQTPLQYTFTIPTFSYHTLKYNCWCTILVRRQAPLPLFSLQIPRALRTHVSRGFTIVFMSWGSFTTPVTPTLSPLFDPGGG